MISPRAYYSLILLLPFAIRWAIMGSDMFSFDLEKDDTFVFPNFVMPLYAVFVGWCWYGFRSMSVADIRHRIRRLPLYFVIPLAVYVPLFFELNDIMSFNSSLRSLLAVGLWTLITGLLACPFVFIYCWLYVITALMLERLFTACGIIKTQGAS